MGRKAKIPDEKLATKIQSALKAACYGTTPQRVFARYDRDKEGTLDAKEFKKLVRTGLKISPQDLTDADLALLIKVWCGLVWLYLLPSG